MLDDEKLHLKMSQSQRRENYSGGDKKLGMETALGIPIDIKRGVYLKPP